MKVIEATENEINEINNKLRNFNNIQVPFLLSDKITKNYVIKKDDIVVAGISALIYQYNVLFINTLFVEKDFRYHGFGSLSLRKVEKDALEKGVRLSHLDTFGFQARDFYLKYDYEIFGILEDCPIGHKRYYMKKILQ